MMPTIGWVFILLGAVLVHGVANGRGFNVFKDLGDMVTAFTAGDAAALSEVLSRSGDKLTEASAAKTPTETQKSLTNGGVDGVAILNEMKRLGGKAKGYRWAATGPDYYDCSGLVWRAMYNLRYAGKLRFTSATFPATSWPKNVNVVRVDGPPQPGDIVLWLGHHIGVADSASTFYGAQSVKSGIKTLKLPDIRGKYTLYRVSVTSTEKSRG